MANPPTRKPPASSKAPQRRAAPAAPKADMEMPKVRAPVPASAASIVMPPSELLGGTVSLQREETAYSPAGLDPAPQPSPRAQARAAPESPLEAFESGTETEFETGGGGDHEPGPPPNRRHPDDHFETAGDGDGERFADLESVDLPEEETLEQTIERIAAMRKPLGAHNQKLAIDKRPDYHTHWFNDEGNRIAEAVEAGWAFRKKRGKTIRRAVGTGRDKGVLWAYAMDIPEYFFRLDMAKKHEFAQERMDSIQRSPVMVPKGGSANRQDAGKFYSPTEMLSIEKRN